MDTAMGDFFVKILSTAREVEDKNVWSIMYNRHHLPTFSKLSWNSLLLNAAAYLPQFSIDRLPTCLLINGLQ